LSISIGDSRGGAKRKINMTANFLENACQKIKNPSGAYGARSHTRSLVTSRKVSSSPAMRSHANAKA
jgi:hypothetical protein